MNFHEFSLESKKSPTFNLDIIIRRQSEIVKRTPPQFEAENSTAEDKSQIGISKELLPGQLPSHC